MKKQQKIYAKALTALEPGKLVWKTIRTFTDFRTADDWLMNYVSTNHYDMESNMKELNLEELEAVNGGNTTPFGIGMPTPTRKIEYPKMPAPPDYVPPILIP